MIGKNFNFKRSQFPCKKYVVLWARLANGNTLVLSNSVHPVAGIKRSRALDDVISPAYRYQRADWTPTVAPSIPPRA